VKYKFHRDLKSRGLAVGKNAIYDFLRYVVDAFLVFQVPIYSASERVRQVNPSKVYGIDVGLLRACAPVQRPDTGRMLENAVFLTLRRDARSVAYHRTESGYEVDFVVQRWDGTRSLVQVCADPSEAGTLERETRALVEARTELGIDDVVIVTLHQEDVVEAGGAKIPVVPAWRFALSRAQEKG